MFRLTREVRFAARSRDTAIGGRANGHAGWPRVTLGSQFLALQVTLAGDLNPSSQYLRNIKDIDAAVRTTALPAIDGLMDATPERVMVTTFTLLAARFNPSELVELRLSLSPYLTYSCIASELPMVRLSQKFEFSASHRLHNPSLTDDANRATFGKCNNPLGHGHNYELQVTITGAPDHTGVLLPVGHLEQVVAERVIDRLDHKNLNVEVPEFAQLIPSVENIARVIYRLLAPELTRDGRRLAAVTVWETPKTWCEYAE